MSYEEEDAHLFTSLASLHLWPDAYCSVHVDFC